MRFKAIQASYTTRSDYALRKMRVRVRVHACVHACVRVHACVLIVHFVLFLITSFFVCASFHYFCKMRCKYNFSNPLH